MDVKIFVMGEHSTDDDPPVPFCRSRFKHLLNAVLAAIKDSDVDMIMYLRSDYYFTYHRQHLQFLREIYPYRHGKAKPRWDLELERIKAIEWGKYP